MRQADSTIKGYLYQFNKSILEILKAEDDDIITLEGVIEDIDIQSSDSFSTIQCKYHEDKKFQLSSVVPPILEMLCHYGESSALGNETKYILFAFFNSNVDEIDITDFKEYLRTTTNKDIQIKYFHRIYKITDSKILDLALKSKKSQQTKTTILDYYSKNQSKLSFCVDLDAFWKCFTYYPSEHFDTLVDEVHNELKNYSDEDTVNNLHYPNAFSKVAMLSAKKDVSSRQITKKAFLDELLSSESILMSNWLFKAIDRKRILKNKKDSLSQSFECNSDIRAFVFSERFVLNNKESITPFISSYTGKYYKKKTLQKPPIFVFDNCADVMQEVILSLHRYQKSVNNGFVGCAFQKDSFINDTDCAPEYICKIVLLSNIDKEVLEACGVNHLYTVGEVYDRLKGSSYLYDELFVENMEELFYLVGLKRKLED